MTPDERVEIEKGDWVKYRQLDYTSFKTAAYVGEVTGIHKQRRGGLRYLIGPGKWGVAREEIVEVRKARKGHHE